MLKYNSVLLIVSISISSACTTQYRTSPLPLPAKPYLWPLKNGDLLCVSDSVYSAIAQRDLARKNYSEQLEAIIQSTWNK